MCGTALAQSGNPTAPEPLILTDAQSEYLLGLHMELLEDPTGKLTIEDVSSPEFDSQFIPCQDETPNFGFSTSAYWVRLRLDNETRRTVDWLLEVDFANTHFVDLYTPLLNGEGFEVRQTGQLRPVSTRDVLHPNIVFNLFVPTLSQQTTYLRFQNGGSMTLPLTLWTKDAFLTNTAQEHLLHGLFYGILICLLIYNLFLLFSLRESSYLYFVIALASMVFFFSSYDGYMEVYVIPNLYYLIQQYMVISWSILFLSIILFTDTFLEIKTQIPKIHRVNIALTGVWGVLILLAPFNNYHFMATLVLPLALISLIVVLGAGIASFQRGFHPARLYLIAWSGLCVTLIIAMLARAGAIPITSFSENLFRLGGIWLGVSWSLALANRINLLKAETEDANRGLQQNQHRLAQILEGLPIGVMVYGQNRKPTYFNQRLLEILNYPKRGVEPDLTAGRTLEEAHKYFSFRVSGSDQEYPLENMPVSQAFEGVTASADDIEADTKERRVPLEVWASPVRDDQGQVESVVSAVLDITQRQKDEAELNEYRRHLEQLVDDRTAQLVVINEVLQSEIGEKERLQGELHLRLEWLVAANLANQTVIRKSDLPRVYQNFVEIIPKLFGAAAAFIAELDPDSAGGELQDEIKPRAGTGLRPGFVIRAHCARNGALPLKNIVSNSIGAVISLPPAIPADSFRKERQPFSPALSSASRASIWT
jgi:PAS domain S-box-containing protein